MAVHLAAAVWAAIIAVPSHPVLGVAAGLFFLESALIAVRVGLPGPALALDPLTSARVRTFVAEISAVAGCAEPTLLIWPDVAGVARVFRRKGRTVLLMSKQFIDRADDGMLRALIAHEIAHIASGDVARAQVQAIRRSVMAGVFGAFAGIAVPLTGPIAPVLFAAVLVAMRVTSVAASYRHRPRELAADSQAALWTGDPAAVIRALNAVGDVARARRQHLFGRGVARWLLFPLSYSLPTHPSPETRIQRLREARPDATHVVPVR